MRSVTGGPSPGHFRPIKRHLCLEKRIWPLKGRKNDKKKEQKGVIAKKKSFVIRKKRRYKKQRESRVTFSQG